MKSTSSRLILIGCLSLLTLVFAIATYYWGRGFQRNIQQLSAQSESAPLVEQLNITGYQQLFATPTPLPSPTNSPTATPSIAPSVTPSL